MTLPSLFKYNFKTSQSLLFILGIVRSASLDWSICMEDLEVPQQVRYKTRRVTHTCSFHEKLPNSSTSDDLC